MKDLNIFDITNQRPRRLYWWTNWKSHTFINNRQKYGL